MNEIVSNVDLLSHPSYIVRISGRKKLEDAIEKNNESEITKLLELATESNVGMVTEILDDVENKMETILPIILALLPHANNSRSLIKIGFNLSWDVFDSKFSSLHPFIQIIKYNTANADIWLDEFPTESLLASMTSKDSFFRSISPILFSTNADYRGLNQKLFNKIVYSVLESNSFSRFIIPFSYTKK